MDEKVNVNELCQEAKKAVSPEEDKDGALLIGCAKKMGELIKEVPSSQLRKLYTEARKIASLAEKGIEVAYQVNLLRVRLAYTAAREPKLKDLYRVLDDALQEVSKLLQKNKEDIYGRFLHFFEAIVAYHRFYRGRE